MAHALIGLGSNLGDRAAQFDAALRALSAGDVQVSACSRFAETPPVGGPDDQPTFLNAAAVVETGLSPSALLARLHEIELAAGRTRDVPWGPRTLDLDLLLYDDVVERSAALTVPHPRLSFRKFALRGAAEVAGAWRHPILDRTLAELLDHLDHAPKYAAAVGLTAGYRSQFMSEAAHVAGARLVEPTPAGTAVDFDALSFEGDAGSERVGSDGPTSTAAIEFISARRSAVAESLLDATDWIVDDGWPAAEAVTLVRQAAAADRDSVWAAIAGVREPRLIACLRRADEEPFVALAEIRRAARSIGLQLELPPAVDVLIADREGALSEFAAALTAAT